jgi:hypothetical protein
MPRDRAEQVVERPQAAVDRLPPGVHPPPERALPGVESVDPPPQVVEVRRLAPGPARPRRALGLRAGRRRRPAGPLVRIAVLRAKPPPGDWDGVWRLTRK